MEREAALDFEAFRTGVTQLAECLLPALIRGMEPLGDARSLDRAAHEAADELAREQDVEHDHRQHRDRQRREDRVPVAHELAEELLSPKGQRGRLSPWGED